MWSDSFYPYVSGVTRSLVDTREYLKALGHEVLVFAPNYPGASAEEDVFRFPSAPAPTNPGFYLTLPFAPGLEQFLDRRRPDVVHIHSPFTAGRLGIRVAKKLDLPVVFTYHTMYALYTHYSPVAGNLLKNIVASYTIAVANRADLVIAPSTAVREYLLTSGVRKPVEVLPSGIRLQDFAGRDREYLRRNASIPPDRPVVLTAGRLAKEKNLDVLLEAFAAMKLKDAVLVLAGDGPVRPELEAKAEALGIRDRVFFLGKVPPSVMPHVYASGDVFVFTSMTETQGLVIAEAKASGLPVVAVNALGVTDAVKHEEDGFLLPNDAPAIASALDLLLFDHERRHRMSSRARENAKAFSMDRVVRELLSIYQKLVAGTGF